VAAHELRNPLAVLKGYAEMLMYQTARGKGAHLAEWQREALEEIDQATARLDKLTEDLLDVTRLQAGRLVLSRDPTDLVALTRRMMTQQQATTKHHVLSLATADACLMVEVDRVRIEQVLTNLLSNAIKYSPHRGSIELAIREVVEPHEALLAVRDRGIGIPIGQQARIFGRFVRAENARASQITGTGLGLFLSREIVEQPWAQAQEAYEELLAYAQHKPLPALASLTYNRLAILAIQQAQDRPTVRALLEDAWQMAQSSSDQRALAETAWNLAQITGMMWEEDLTRALESVQKGVI
jgi:signal transduction histidine kinase